MVKTLIIGIDGGTFDVINPLIKKRKLPHLKKIMDCGVYATCRSTFPPVTGAAWPSMLLGQGPGKHGVFSFFKKDITDYGQLSRGEDFVTSEIMAGKTFMDVISDRGGRVGIITVPMTYPTWRVNGLIISGYPCPDTQENFVYQSDDIKLEIEQALNFQASYYDSVSLKKLEQDEHEMTERRMRVVTKLLQQYSFDCLMVVFGSTDRIQHEYWRFREGDYPAAKTEREQFQGAIDRIYQKVDDAIGEILRHTDDKTNVLILSDHGGGAKPKTYFNIHTWLRQMGDLTENRGSMGLYSALKKILRASTPLRFLQEKLLELTFFSRKLSQLRKEVAVSRFDWSKTKAYLFKMEYPVSGIIINLQGRQKQGVVAPGQYEKYRDELIASLQDLKDKQGRKVVKEIYRREEIYTGEFTEQAPDVVFLVNNWCLPDEELRDKVFTSVPDSDLIHISGLHRMEGMFIAKGPLFKPQGKIADINIVDVAGYVFASHTLPIPESVESEVRSEILNQGVKKERIAKDKMRKAEKKVLLSSAEQEQIKKKLQRLGYL